MGPELHGKGWTRQAYILVVRETVTNAATYNIYTDIGTIQSMDILLQSAYLVL